MSKNKSNTSQVSSEKISAWPTSSWNNANKPYYDGNKSYDDCKSECLSDPNCKTMTGFKTYPSAPSRPCRYYDNVIPTSDIRDVGGSWEGNVVYKKDVLTSEDDQYNDIHNIDETHTINSEHNENIDASKYRKMIISCMSKDDYKKVDTYIKKKNIDIQSLKSLDIYQIMGKVLGPFKSTNISKCALNKNTINDSNNVVYTAEGNMMQEFGENSIPTNTNNVYNSKYLEAAQSCMSPGAKKKFENHMKQNNTSIQSISQGGIGNTMQDITQNMQVALGNEFKNVDKCALNMLTDQGVTSGNIDLDTTGGYAEGSKTNQYSEYSNIHNISETKNNNDYMDETNTNNYKHNRNMDASKYRQMIISCMSKDDYNKVATYIKKNNISVQSLTSMDIYQITGKVLGPFNATNISKCAMNHNKNNTEKFDNLLPDVNIHTLIIAIVTSMIVFNIFGNVINVPTQIQKIMKNKIAVWVMCYLFVYNVAANKNTKMSIIVTGSLFGMTQLLHP